MTLKLNGSSSGSVSIDAPASTTSGADITFKLPVADGSANQVIKTDASGNLGWTTPLTQTVGTWTPADGSGAGLTFSSAVGHYVLMGKLCTVFCFTEWPSTSASGNVRISGLPATVKNVTDGDLCGGAGYARLEYNGSYYPNMNSNGVAVGVPNTTNVDLFYSSGLTPMTNALMGADQSGVDRAGNKLIFSLTYQVE